MKLQQVIAAIALLLCASPAVLADDEKPWQDQYGGPHNSDYTGKQVTPGGYLPYLFQPWLPQTSTGTAADLSVNPMPVTTPGFDLGFGGQGHAFYTGTYAWEKPNSILPPCATSSMVNLSVLDESAFDVTRTGYKNYNPDPSYYDEQHDAYKETSPYWNPDAPQNQGEGEDN